MGDIGATEALSNADGLLDYIQVLFLTDLGEGHMESFDQGEQFDFDTSINLESNVTAIPFIQYIPDSKPVIQQHHDQANYLDHVPILRRYVLSHIDFRGPPVQA